MLLDFISYPINLRDGDILISYTPIYSDQGIVLKVKTTRTTIARVYDQYSNDYHQDVKMLDAALEQQKKKLEIEYNYL